MKNDTLFQYYLDEVKREFSGWDFSYISETGRIQSELLSWSYGSMVLPLIQNSKSTLDMGTGGGEFLSLLQPFPKRIVATEAYEPNVPIAKAKLEPLGVKVIQIKDDETADLPFADRQFDLIINRHEYYPPAELRRIIEDGGMFVTQQVGGQDCVELNKVLGASSNEDYIHWNLVNAVKELEDNHFKVMISKEAFPIQRFYDLGAVIYYLKAIPWQIPDFSIELYKEALFRTHQRIQSDGYFDVHQHRFIIKAIAK